MLKVFLNAKKTVKKAVGGITFCVYIILSRVYILGIVDLGVSLIQGALTAIVFAFLAYRFWLNGLSKYESSGK